jgi:hypothetical protein
MADFSGSMSLGIASARQGDTGDRTGDGEIAKHDSALFARRMESRPPQAHRAVA